MTNPHLSQKYWHVRHQLSRWLRTLRRDGWSAVLRVANERIKAWYADKRRSPARNTRDFVFPFIESTPRVVADSPRVSLIIPVYNGLAYVEQCIAAIYAHPVQTAFEVVVIDQASTDGSREYLRQIAAQRANFHLIENPVNVGFPRAVNQGAAAACGDFLMIVNSDVILAPECIDRLVAALDMDIHLAVVSPMTNYVGRGPQVDPAAETLRPADIVDYAASIANRAGIWPVVDHLVFFCVMARRDVFEYLNGMSEVYGLGNYEDNDFCLRARVAGFTLAIVPGAFAFHFGSRTFKEQQLAHTRWMQQNERLYYVRAAHLSTSLPLLHRPLPATNRPWLTVAIDAQTYSLALIPTLSSLAHQTVTCFEVVIVGDATALKEIVTRYADILSISCVSLQSGGSAFAWNQAIAVARGVWLTYLRAGDVLYPTHIETLVSLAKDDVSLVCTGVNEALCWHHGERSVVLARAPYFRDIFNPKRLLIEPVLPAPAFAHSVTCLSRVGEFDPELGPFTDWDFLLRLSACYGVSWSDAVTAERRFQVGSLPDFVSVLPQLAEAQKTILQTIYARHPVTDIPLQRARHQVVTAWEQKAVELKWLAMQEWDMLSKVKQMASVWLDVEE